MAEADRVVMASSWSDTERFGELVHRHGPAIYRYLVHRVGRDIAQDLLAETFLVAFRKRHDYEHHAETVLPWLYGIATNLVRNHSRSEQRRTLMLGRLAAQRIDDTSRGGVDEGLDLAATAQEVAHAVSNLSSREREVFVLVTVEGLSYEEAAAALSVPIGTVRSRLSRARAALRVAINAEQANQQGELSGLQARRGEQR